MRDESKLLIIEIYKWIGKDTLMPLIQNVQPIQVMFSRKTRETDSNEGEILLDARIKK